MDKVEKMGKFAQSVEADPAAKAAMEEADKDEDIAKAMTTGESVKQHLRQEISQGCRVL